MPFDVTALIPVVLTVVLGVIGYFLRETLVEVKQHRTAISDVRDELTQGLNDLGASLTEHIREDAAVQSTLIEKAHNMEKNLDHILEEVCEASRGDASSRGLRK